MERHTYAEVTKCLQNVKPLGTTQVAPENLDNIPSRSSTVNPLLIEVVLNKVLKFSQSQQDKKHFSSLRTVCKLWNTNVLAILRQTREISISRLFSRYPHGLGWKYNLQTTSNCYFRCPFPETLIFESLQISGTCKNLKDIKTGRFLAVYGHHIKSLHFSSSLHCSHQTKFLLNILHSWCPNLETLQISSVHHLSGLFNISKNTDQSIDFKFNCGNLKTLIISVECPEAFSSHFPPCDSELDAEFSDRVYFFIHILRLAHRQFDEIKDKIPPPQDKSMDNSTKFFDLIQGQIEKSLNPQMGCLTHFMFLGTLGHILRFAPLQKLVVKKLDSIDESRSLAYFLLHHPSKPLQKLRHIEFCADVLVGKDQASLLGLSIPKTGFTVFHFDNIASSKKNLESLYKILENCKESLKHLRIGNNCTCCAFKRTVLEFPKLPNLETLVIKHINCFSVDGMQLLGNLPKLERLELLRDVNQVGGYDDVFVNTFCANFGKDGDQATNIRGFPLRELKFDGYLTSQSIMEICRKEVGNLERVELFVDCVANLERFLRCVGGKLGKLEDLRLSVGMASRSVYRKEMDRCIKVLRDELSQLQGLKFLDLAFRFRRRKILLPVDVFRNGFQKMKGLRSLKLTNFRTLLVNKEVIERCTAHIPFVYFSEMDYIQAE